MVACGLFLAAVALLGAALAWRRRRLPDHPAFLRLAIVAAPLGFVAIEAGWVVTEVGRQPWVIHGILRTADAVTPMPGLVVPFTAFTLLYLVLAGIVVVLMRRQVFASPLLLPDPADDVDPDPRARRGDPGPGARASTPAGRPPREGAGP
jgi:cytochrome d ubiquinol oxidase subunit I